MKKIDILNNLDFGNAIAEYDNNIAQYYINTPATIDLVNDRKDIIRGAKGSGKTAMLVSLFDNQLNYKQLDGKLFIKAIELTGDPDFQRAFSTVIIENTDTQKLIDAWKIYFINVIWKKYSEVFPSENKLGDYLQKNGLLALKTSIFENLIHAIKFVNLKVSNTIKPDGSSTQSLEISPNSAVRTRKTSIITGSLINYNYIFEELDSLICLNNSCFWIMIDRLDDAFPDNTERNTLILKALFYAYKDICRHTGFKLKIFIRDDIFSRITTKGFTSLSHVSAKTMDPLKWKRDHIEQLVVERLLFNTEFKEYVKLLGINTDYETLSPDDRMKIINILIKPQIDVGNNNPDSLGWIINHVKDGKGLFTPRDIISLLDKARSYQLLELQENNKSEISSEYLISSNAIRLAYNSTSEEKLVTQLYAEYPKYKVWIEKFKSGKSEYTEKALEVLLGRFWYSRTEKLVEIGFLEKKKSSYKIPFIYRAWLSISQGKAK